MAIHLSSSTRREKEQSIEKMTTKAEFLAELAQTLEIDPKTFTDSTVLRDLPNWDSMRLLEVIALVDEQLGINLNADQLAKCENAGQLIALIRGGLPQQWLI